MDFLGICAKICTMKTYEVIIIGAGAAGLTAATNALQHHKSVAVLEMGNAPARKVRASGGGRCNITNMSAGHDRYFGENPNFVRGALSRVTPIDILNWAKQHKIELIEKNAGQFFCKNGAQAVVDALIQDATGADIIYNTTVSTVSMQDELFYIQTNNNTFSCHSLIVATGGTSFAALGVSDIGYKIAKSFGHKIIPVRPALCAISVPTFSSELAGISVESKITIGKRVIRDSLLFTHAGIGGPAVYRATLSDIDTGLKIDLLPDINLTDVLRNAKKTNGKKGLVTILSEYLPNKVAKWVVKNDSRNIADIKDIELDQIVGQIKCISIPATEIKYHGMASAEVVRGGVDTNDVSSKTMESKLCAGLFFAGEALDIAGDLGGFNLHWAWASGHVAGQNA